MTNNYEFFKNCHFYIEYENYALKDSLDDLLKNMCTCEKEEWKQYHTEICQNFKKLVIYINNRKLTDTLVTNNKYEDYLNFWINFHLEKYKDNKIKPSDFYINIRAKDIQFSRSTFHINISNIEKDILENMKVLYSLYQEFYNIFVSSYSTHPNIETCKGYANKCISTYKNFIKHCPTKDAQIFCTALSDFEQVYNSIRSNKPFDNNHLPKLPSYEDAIKVEKQLLDVTGHRATHDQVPSTHTGNSHYGEDISPRHTIFVILGSLLGIFLILLSMYMFTPFGSWLRRRIKQKRIIFANFKNEENQLLNNDEMLIYSDNMNYNISYNSTENT
ncbi:PIR Superfamily Protein [Plasmodium ovale curtisi]|uniref:PIR Superfamily Protein n=1 Tax=Plasmodium ovale curtisi TaxID=864141 RepID=A0A1A8WJ64_PLAOA|nr:PIR Superfamily Protein [Plasmodium ovale curtisi]